MSDLTYEKAREQSRILREYLFKRYGDISIQACMSAIAVIHGYKSWYELKDHLTAESQLE